MAPGARAWRSTLNEWPPRPIVVVGLLALAAAAIALRVALFPVVVGDYTSFLSPWYDYIVSHGGWPALKDNFSNYNIPYLVLLTLATYLPLPKLIAIKSISLLGDSLLALFAGLALSVRFPRSLVPVLGALIMLFAPTVVINGAAWGQCDALYTAFCLGSLYCLMIKRPGWACALFGVALGFKLQAVFYAPVLAVAMLRGRIKVWQLAWIPLVFVALLTPAYVQGRDPLSLLSIYTEQVDTGGVIGPAGEAGVRGGRIQQPGGQRSEDVGPSPLTPGQGTRSGPRRMPFGSTLSYNAPTIYKWLNGTALAKDEWVGIVLAGFALVALVGLVLWRRAELDAGALLTLSLVCAVSIPFLLPKMHERYFYLADALSIVYACWFARRAVVAVGMQAISLLSYAPFLWHAEPVALGLVAFGVLALAAFLWRDLVRRLPGPARAT